MDQNAGRIVEPPTWRVRPLSPLAYFSNNEGEDGDGGEEGEQEDGWEGGEGEDGDGDEDTHGSGEEGEDEDEDEGEGDDIDNGGDGGRWASLVCFSDTLNAFSLMCGTRIAF